MKKIAIVLLSIVMMLSSLACALPQGMRMSASSPAAQQTEKDAAKETDDAAKSDAKADDKADDKAEADADADADTDAEADTDAGDTEEPDDGRFPAELFGVWKLVSCEGLEQNEAKSFGLFVVNYDGQVVNSRSGPYAIYDEDDAETATVVGDEIVIPLFEDAKEDEEADLHLYYSVEDSEDGPVLTLSIIGEVYDTSETAKADAEKIVAYEMDAELVYEKADGEDLTVLYEYAMIGDWTDSNGRTWTFKRVEDKSHKDVEFELRTKSGGKIKCNITDPVRFEYDETADEILASLKFENRRNDISGAEVESFDGYTLVLTLDDETLELTRVK